jgi:hypothetical protein
MAVYFLLFPMDASRDMGMAYPIYERVGTDYKVFAIQREEPLPWEIDIKYYYMPGLQTFIKDICQSRKEIEFEINPLNSNIIAKGKGYVGSYTFFGALLTDEIPNHLYGFSIVTTEEITFS